MATITISIICSPLEKIAGIPSNIAFQASIPSTIFYNINEAADPTTDSLIALGPIELPTNKSRVLIKVFATNGVDSSPIITQEYFTNVIGGRNSHDTATTYIDSGATYPFGDLVEAGNCTTFGNTAGVIVDNQQDSTRQPDGYTVQSQPDSEGVYQPDGGAGYYIPPKSKYQVLFSETDAIGQTGRGIGTLPGRVLWVKPRNDNTQKTSSNMQRPLFDPKALVIFQDSREEPYDPSIPKINKPYFDLEDQSKARDGSMLTINDAITPAGSFLKAHYNPMNNTMTYYYYDNRVARWIISTEPYSYNQNPTSNLAGIVTRSRGDGIGYVFKWIPFQYRRLI